MCKTLEANSTHEYRVSFIVILFQLWCTKPSSRSYNRSVHEENNIKYNIKYFKINFQWIDYNDYNIHVRKYVKVYLL